VKVQLLPGYDLRVSGDRVTFAAGAAEWTFEPLAPGLAGALAGLKGGLDEKGAARLLGDLGGAAALAEWWAIVYRLQEMGALVYRLEVEGSPLASLYFGRAAPEMDFAVPRDRVALSPYVFLQIRDGEFVLDSPLATGAVVLHQLRALPLLALLSSPQLADELEALLPALGAPTCRALLAFLSAAALVQKVEAHVDLREQHRSWEFHDLLFHRRSQGVRADWHVGARRLPLVRAPSFAPLQKASPILSHLPIRREAETAPLSYDRVLATRRSSRSHGKPPSLEDVGFFLYRAAHRRGERCVYPSAGGCYPLNIYLVAGKCDGWGVGVYRYWPEEHALEALAVPAEVTLGALDARRCYMETRQQPQLLVMLTARMERVAWKYEGVAYANVLRDVGVLYESMYLAAAATGLACCALGAASLGPLQSWVDPDPLAESAVGELLLGGGAAD
jgi:SagB-type dehydrogenase family enzyme